MAVTVAVAVAVAVAIAVTVRQHQDQQQRYQLGHPSEDEMGARDRRRRSTTAVFVLGKLHKGKLGASSPNHCAYAAHQNIGTDDKQRAMHGELATHQQPLCDYIVPLCHCATAPTVSTVSVQGRERGNNSL
ncbi:hypothetical protein K504DRAFT_497307 [Pleomassaria siparia CBS 279.74]|uniref:Secreted protein n=1 Tax=Pleomassaria siparia CBS 279.74 TaxID=1314801 RepID=A0A6G1KRF1_9PLEO|nr:hypothetical protein K504DRAFT_497307 [Pleomassaria siparia CBS 279.74]